MTNLNLDFLKNIDISLKDLIGIPVFLLLVLIGMFLFPEWLETFVLIGIITAILPVAIQKIIEQKIEKEMEEQFIRFALDLAEALQTGLTISKALYYISKNDYGYLTDPIRRLSARIDWGIRLEESFEIFARETGSKFIQRNIKILLELYKAGGDLGKSLRSLINGLMEIKKLRKEREAVVYENILHSYFVFMFFIGIAFVLKVFLIPYLKTSMSPSFKNLNVEVPLALIPQGSGVDLGEALFHICLMQAFFAGIALGKMSENSYKAGLKHSLFFIILVIVIFKVIAPLIPAESFMSMLPQT